MGRMTALHASRRVGPQQIAAFVLVGFVIGSVLGYIFMATVHAMLEIKAENHYGSAGVVQVNKGQQQQQTDVQQQQQQQQQQQADQQVIADGAAKGVVDATASLPTTGDTIHTLCTSNGSPYLNFQLRIMYGTYKLVQQMPGGEKLVAFTRILHRMKPDVLMDEVPTWRAQPLHPECDTWCEFPVADRPNAVQQWVDAAKKDPSLIKAPWLLMIETDYVWMKPVAAPMAESSSLSIAFPFGYIQPTAASHENVMRLMYPPEKGPLTNVQASGPAPVLMRWNELFKICPEWERLTYHIEHDAETKEKLGWVREMYAWDIGAALQGVKFDLQLPPLQKLITQPPADQELGEAAMFHYTWGTIWTDASGAEVWKFDKRFYTDANLELEVPLIPMPPQLDPAKKLKQQDSQPVTQKLVAVYELQITQMNKAIALLPKLTRSS
mmetsp:Transcript_4256/g.12271  ORF Transcript_4256/g.12271 Transcript_4256/m.12271 type:complete len:438 (-) Transcript_4256:1868-3181(-)|eukprot:CAMPEP_0206136184 /NCGR_PEP_ID=MMETSP1473-20131121/1416_1 /ASSEMBLY_ACC=CAM_ASM_001109 /TAXON_ID=1461547 /ORGANISM="Stichococcus sp, Strain RCC1054" /LENGTH=437 /DNA_ID=CAMNT_0053528525 /DNA_START=220 /DNA_END=1533 /DNA_ORIENTATION=-